MVDNQALANAIFELTSVMPVRSTPRLIQKKNVDTKTRHALRRLDEFLSYFSRKITAPESPILLKAVDLIMEQYNRINHNTELKTVAADETALPTSSPFVDLVFPLRTFSAHEDNLELRFALRSIEKYLTGYRNIIVVSKAAPDWLRNVIVIDDFDDSQRKEVNFFAAILAAAEHSDADFVQVWCDDFALLRRLEAGQVKAMSNGRDLGDHPGGSPDWRKRLQLTAEALKKRGRTTKNFESHTPGMFNRKKFIALANEFNIERLTAPGVTCYSLYHNFYGSRALPMNTFKATFEKKIGGDEIVAERCDGKFFLGYNDNGFESGVQEYLSRQFPAPSKYESQ